MSTPQFWRKQKDDDGRECKYFPFNEAQNIISQKLILTGVEQVMGF
jgi:hypothetical protein